MSDLIDRQAAIRAVMTDVRTERTECLIHANMICKRIEDLPSAELEIIRCKDCKFYDGRPCGIVDWYNTADDFCSRAERRTYG